VAAARGTKGSDLRWAVEGPPVGAWAVPYGTAGVLMGEELVLRADGTGTLTTSSVMSGEEEIALKWVHSGPAGWTSPCRFRREKGKQKTFPSPLVVRYHARQIHNEAGALTTVLCDVGGENFGPLGGPLAFVGDIE
jgi:hypothetical protein